MGVINSRDALKFRYEWSIKRPRGFSSELNKKNVKKSDDEASVRKSSTKAHTPGTRSRDLAQAATAVVIGILAAVAIPAVLGEDFATRESAKLYAPLDAWFYGEGSRQRISTVIVDDDSLAQAGQTWPPTYNYYARLLRGISYYHPRAIFLDVVLNSERDDPSIHQLVNGLCAIERSGVRVYLAALRSQSGDLVLRPELQGVSGRCFTGVSVDYRPDEVDHLTWTYDLATSKANKATRSAALSIYDDVSGNVLPMPTSPMAISWGSSPAVHGLRWTSAASTSRNPSSTNNGAAYCRTTHGIFELLPPGLHRIFRSDAQKPLCVFHNTVYAHDLANATPMEDHQISANLTNRIVMVGTSRNYTNDFVTSPIHDRIPGVYLHAMALDNLMSYGSNYKRATGFAPSNDRDHWRLFILAIVSLAFVLIFHRCRAGIDEWWKAHTAAATAIPSPPPEIYLVDVVSYGVEQPSRDLVQIHRAPQPGSKKPRKYARPKAAACALAASALKALCSVAIIATLLLIGERWLNIGYFSVASVATFSLAAEWLEWNRKLLGWLFHGCRSSKSDVS